MDLPTVGEQVASVYTKTKAGGCFACPLSQSDYIGGQLSELAPERVGTLDKIPLVAPKMTIIKQLTLILASLVGSLAADSLVVIGNHNGVLPYYYGESLEKGLLVEVIKTFSNETGFDSHFQPSPVNRQAWFLEHGTANAIFAHPSWMPTPELMHLIGPLFYWRDRLFAQPGHQPDDIDTLTGTICLRQGFTYSDQLESSLGNRLHRFEASNDDLLVRMFLGQRCDYAIMDDLDFQYRAKQGEVDPELYTTSIVDAEWPVYLGILKTETALIEAAEAFFTPERFNFEQ